MEAGMKVGVPREVAPGERRVAATPQTVERLKKQGFEVVVESGAGELASFPDRLYVAAGAVMSTSPEAIWAEADIVLKINAPMHHPALDRDEVELLREGTTLISFIWPAQNEALVARLAKRNATVLAMDAVPRISRAQKMDALSSLGNIAGYRAVIEAASHFGSFFTGQFTAAGKVPPAKVLIIGAGVAGLAAIGAARGLGAIVRAFDTREAVKDQVRSLGGEFLELEFEESGEGKGGYAKVMSKEFIDAEMAMFREQAKEVDIVITTALIPGRPAPKLWMSDMVESMKPGSVIVDLAAKNGGNCELTVPGEVVVKHDVTIVGHNDLTSRLATTASNLYGTNLTHVLDDMGKADGFKVDLTDEVIRGALIAHGGEVMWPPPPVEKKTPAKKAVDKKPVEQKPAEKAAPAAKAAQDAPAKKSHTFAIVAALLIGAWIILKTTMSGSAGGGSEVQQFMQHMTVFVLACFVGWQVVWNVSAALHTPLMSVTNAISGIIIVGGMLQARGELTDAATILGALAILLATINIAGGFLVTERMLRMFRR
ncbi:MAG: NAD(P) transhydrogenase subunit alpha [Myxococcota bacterium]|jgi:NAD(P) transhydrogenase subunit alpha